MGITLQGMTWDHPRGSDPLLACARAWQEMTGVGVRWDARSLQDFEAYPLKDLAERYDLIVIDHPHIGQAADENCLLPLDEAARAAELFQLAGASVGPSFESYRWAGRIWALPIDTAAQVQAYNPALLPVPAASWGDVLELARAGKVSCPLRPPHALMSFFTLCGLNATPCRTDGGPLIEVESGARAFAMLQELAAHLDEADFARDPIAVLEAMASTDSAIACAPLIYGYVSYARAGFRANQIAFADLPSAGAGSCGSALGGTGIAVSRMTGSSQEAVALAYWLASGAVQAGLYATSGGQPAHAAAWQDDRVNTAAPDFYRATRATLDAAWLRPRHRGYMRFQHEASSFLAEALKERMEPHMAAERLNILYRESLPG